MGQGYDPMSISPSHACIVSPIRSPDLHLLLCTTLETPLHSFRTPFFIDFLLDILEVMDMFCFLSPLIQVVPRPLPQTVDMSGMISSRCRSRCIDPLSETLLELLLPLPLLELFSPIPLLVEPLFATPFIPSHPLDLSTQHQIRVRAGQYAYRTPSTHLFSQKQHHITISRSMRIRPQQMR